MDKLQQKMIGEIPTLQSALQESLRNRPDDSLYCYLLGQR